ncbi:MAG TPA: dihydroneopterin aldolase [Verrucomicrobiae bacterium]
MDIIHIHDLEVSYRVGVPDEERAKPQRLLLDLQLHLDFRPAAATDDLTKTINYFAVTQQLLKFGEGREWKLIEKLAEDIASAILKTYRPQKVRVEVKKFIIPETRHISVAIERGS